MNNLKTVLCKDGGIMKECYKWDGGQINVRTLPAWTVKDKHRHNETDEYWYLIAGGIQVELDFNTWTTTHTMNPGDALRVRRGVWHTVRNGSKESVLVFWMDKPYNYDNPDKELWKRV